MPGMNLARPSFRFSLRAMFLLIVAAASFLGWRLWDFEKATVTAIERAGGKVYFRCQNPILDGPCIPSRDENLVESCLEIQAALRPKFLPPPSIRDLIWGRSASRIAAVDMPLEKMSPDMVARLCSLRDLKTILVRVDEDFPGDASDGARIGELKAEFPGRLWVTDTSEARLSKWKKIARIKSDKP
jgi:hypothetical protein